jgi:hypothetical protein
MEAEFGGAHLSFQHSRVSDRRIVSLKAVWAK